MQAEDIVFRKAWDSLDQPSPSARALAIFLAVKGVLTGRREFSHTQVISDPSLRRVYDQIRGKQAELMEEALDDSEVWETDDPDTETEDEDDFRVYENEPATTLAEFQDQIAEDIEALEADLIESNAGSGAIALKTDQFYALNAVVADALARYEYTESELSAYMLSIMGLLD